MADLVAAFDTARGASPGVAWACIIETEIGSFAQAGATGGPAALSGVTADCDADRWGGNARALFPPCLDPVALWIFLE